ncbi:hypothetical protein VTN02DRAFT_3116 [Thermoascus thermophilus]
MGQADGAGELSGGSPDAGDSAGEGSSAARSSRRGIRSVERAEMVVVDDAEKQQKNPRAGQASELGLETIDRGASGALRDASGPSPAAAAGRTTPCDVSSPAEHGGWETVSGGAEAAFASREPDASRNRDAVLSGIAMSAGDEAARRGAQSAAPPSAGPSARSSNGARADSDTRSGVG